MSQLRSLFLALAALYAVLGFGALHIAFLPVGWACPAFLANCLLIAQGYWALSKPRPDSKWPAIFPRKHFATLCYTMALPITLLMMTASSADVKPSRGLFPLTAILLVRMAWRVTDGETAKPTSSENPLGD